MKNEKDKREKLFLYLLPLFCFLLALEGLSAQYVNVDSNNYNDGGRFFGIYISGSSLYVRGKNFENIELSDYEASSDNPDEVFIRASQGNINSARGGFGIGFITLKPGSVGGGLEGEFFYFDNPRIWNFGAFINFDLLDQSKIQLAPYFKLGATGIDMLLGTVQASPGVNNIDLTQIDRFRGRGAVDVRAGDELKIVETSLYYQSGFQFNYRISHLISLFVQAGYHEAYYRDFKLQVTGAKNYFEEGSFELDVDDPAIVKPGTIEPANLDPEIRIGPLYLSFGINFVLSGAVSDLN